MDRHYNRFNAKEINASIQLKIKHELCGFKLDENGNEFKYLLNTGDLNNHVLVIEGIDSASSLPFDCHFDKSKQPEPKIGETDRRKDVFDELIPIMMDEENCRARILLPYNKAGNHWLTGELVLDKKGKAISVQVYAHDPYGKGKLSVMRVKKLEDRMKRVFVNFDIEVTSEISQYTTNRLSLADSISSGFIVVEELVKRINDESLILSAPYPIGALQLRTPLFRLSNECDNSEHIYLTTDEVEDQKCLVLSIKEVGSQVMGIINSKDSSSEKVKKLQKIERDYYQPLVKQLAYKSSFEETKDLVIVLHDICVLTVALGDLQGELNLFTEAAVFCQYTISILKEKFTKYQIEEFVKRYSVNPSDRWNEIQEKLVTRIGGKLNMLHSMEKNAKEYDTIVTNMRNATRQAFELIDKGLEEFRKRNPNVCMDDHRNTIVKPVRYLFEGIADNMKSLLGKLYEDSEKLMATPPPCRYAIIGLGSLALQQITPYSDFEFAILTESDPHENPDVLTYFDNLSHLANLKTIGLGETGIAFSRFHVDLDHLVHVGLNFDLGGKTPLGRKDKFYSLIKTVDWMLEYVYNKDDKISHIDKNLPYILENVCYVSGFVELVEEYQNKVSKFLNSDYNAKEKQCEVRALRILKEGAIEFDYANKQVNFELNERMYEGDLRKLAPQLTYHLGTHIDVKQEVYRLSERMVYNLGLYFGIEGNSCWDTIEKMEKKGIINGSACKNLQSAVTFANLLRLKTYFKHKAQTNQMSIYPEPPTKLELPKEDLEENGELFNYYYRALPLYNKIVEFCADHEGLTHFEKQSCFQTTSFFDCDSETKGLIYFRLEQFEIAQKHLENALETSNREDMLRILSTLGETYIKTGDYDKAIEMYDSLVSQQKSLSVPIVSNFLNILGLLLLLKGKYVESIECFKETLAMGENYNGNPVSPMIAESLHLLGTAYCTKGDCKSAMKYFQMSLDVREQICKGSLEHSIAFSLINIAVVHVEEGDFDSAIYKYEMGLKIQETLFKGAPNRNIANTLRQIGVAHLKRGEFDLAFTYFEQSLNMLNGIFKGVSTQEHASIFNSIGSAYESKGEYNLALSYYKKSLSISQEIFNDKDQSAVADSLDNIGKAYNLKGEFDLALMYHIESLNLRRKLFEGAAHRDVAVSLNNIGVVYKSKGDYNLALKYFEECLEIQRNIFNDDFNPHVATTLNNIGSIHHSKGDYEKALDYIMICLQIRKTFIKNAVHPAIANSLNNVGRVYGAKGDYFSALKYFKEGLDMRRALFKDNGHPAVASSLEHIGCVLQSKGYNNSALECLEENLEIQRSVFNNDTHRTVAIAIYNIGSCHLLKGENDLSLGYFKKCLDIQRVICSGDSQSELVHTLQNMGCALSSKGEYSLALKYFEESVDILRTISNDDNHMDVAKTLYNMGSCHIPNGDFELGLDCYKKSLEILRAIFNDDARSLVATSLNNIGSIHHLKGEYDLALEYYEESLTIRRALFADHAHPDVADSLYNIAICYLLKGSCELAARYLKECIKTRRAYIDDDTNTSLVSSLKNMGGVALQRGTQVCTEEFKNNFRH